MTAQSKDQKTTEEPTGLDLMRKPFAAHLISKLPKPTKAQTEEVRRDFKAGIRCSVCGGWHHPKVVHLDYVGHAALTDRLLDCDPNWNWEPLSVGEDGAPKLDSNGGMWIRLTVCGVSRLGYGHPDGKTGGDAVKEVIGDALRNAAMRFGAALDLWHKGELHPEQPGGETPNDPDHNDPPRKTSAQAKRDGDFETIKAEIEAIKSPEDLRAWGVSNRERIGALPKAFADPIRDAYEAHMEDLKSWIDDEAEPADINERTAA